MPLDQIVPAESVIYADLCHFLDLKWMTTVWHLVDDQVEVATKTTWYHLNWNSYQSEWTGNVQEEMTRTGQQMKRTGWVSPLRKH